MMPIMAVSAIATVIMTGITMTIILAALYVCVTKEKEHLTAQNGNLMILSSHANVLSWHIESVFYHGYPVLPFPKL